MRRRGMPDAHTAHPNVTPLIDIVMCLIIFFMLIAKIGVSTGAEQMTIPTTLTGKKIEDMGNTLLLNIRAGEDEQPRISALVDGKQTELHLRDAAGKPELTNVLKYFRYGETGKPNAARDNPNFSVIVRADETLAYRYLEPVLMAAAEANVKNVSFNAKDGTGAKATGAAGVGGVAK